ncbi:hypothetical protein [Glaciecola sp. 1036]|uniref:hypothetical protein n=1 Tax=Alteromonadaceae TaxID=72275 RepID=UPI003D08E281
MSLFGKKKIRISEPQTMLNLAQFQTLIRNEREYHALAAVIGYPIAEESLKDIFWMYTNKYKLSGLVLTSRNWEEDKFGLCQMLVRQRTRILRTGKYVEGIFRKAFVNQLATGLRTTANSIPEAQYGANPRDLDAVKGAKWIDSCSNSNEMSVMEIANVIIEARHSNRSVFQLETLEYLHDRLVPKGSIHDRRPLNVEQPWPSSGAAKMMQRKVAHMVRTIGARTHLLSDDDWDNFACYFLGAFTRTHGFADGNGRPNRALYVLTMIEGFRPFVAPTHEFEQQRLIHSAEFV